MDKNAEKRLQDEAICRDWARRLWVQETPEYMELRDKAEGARKAIDMRDAFGAPQWSTDASIFARDMRTAFDTLHAAEEALASLDTRLGEQFDAATEALWKHEDSAATTMIDAVLDFARENTELLNQVVALAKQSGPDARVGALALFEGFCEGFGQSVAEDHGAEFVADVVAKARAGARHEPVVP